LLWQTPSDKRVRAVQLAREALDAMGAAVCPTAVSASISYPYAYAEELTPQEREPDGRARAELAEVWGWLQRKGIMDMTSYDKRGMAPTGRGAALQHDDVAASVKEHSATTSRGRAATDRLK
jgi:chromosome partitioning protein